MRRLAEAAFFDLYGTLIDLSGLAVACEAAAPERGEELAVRWRARQLEATWLRNSMGRWADFDEVTAQALAVASRELGLAGSDVARTLGGAWLRLPARGGVVELLDRLSSRGLPLGVLSNGSASMIAASLEAAGLATRIEHRLSVDAVRRYKPAPEVYGLATEATRLPSERIGFVTANGWDAAGAAAFGFRVAWLAAPGSPLPAVGPLDPSPTPVGLDGVANLFAA